MVRADAQLEVVVLNRQRRRRIGVPRLRRILEGASRVLAVRGEVSVVFAGDRLLRRLNRHYRGRDRATDVLSFSGAGGEEGSLREIA